jgi:hypothetical protein
MEAIRLFSPKYQGSAEAWHWLCERSNGRPCATPALNEAQRAYAYKAGYL